MTKAQVANNDKRAHETRSAPTTKKAIDVNTLHAPMQHWAGGRITSSQHYKARLLLLATSAGRRGGARATSGTDAAVREPLLLLRGLQDLERIASTQQRPTTHTRSSKHANKQIRCGYIAVACEATRRTWNEHIRVSSTLIMAPALSNSPQ